MSSNTVVSSLFLQFLFTPCLFERVTGMKSPCGMVLCSSYIPPFPQGNWGRDRKQHLGSFSSTAEEPKKQHLSPVQHLGTGCPFSVWHQQQQVKSSSITAEKTEITLQLSRYRHGQTQHTPNNTPESYLCKSER